MSCVNSEVGRQVSMFIAARIGASLLSAICRKSREQRRVDHVDSDGFKGFLWNPSHDQQPNGLSRRGHVLVFAL